MTDDSRLRLLAFHSLAMATVRAPEARAHRAFLTELAAYAPDEPALPEADPRADARLAPGLPAGGAARRFAARLRGTVLGAAAHSDTVRKEVEALALAALEGEEFDKKLVIARALAAFDASRADLERDVVRLGPLPPPDNTDDNTLNERWLRRWGSTRSLELNAFVATFTRDGTQRAATALTSSGSFAAPLRFSLAVGQAALSLAPELHPSPALADDARTVEAALAPLLASLASALRQP